MATSRAPAARLRGARAGVCDGSKDACEVSPHRKILDPVQRTERLGTMAAAEEAVPSSEDHFMTPDVPRLEPICFDEYFD